MDSVVINFTDIDNDVVSRANEVHEKLTRCQSGMIGGYLDMCELLLEAHDNAYHTVYGYTRFGDWIEKGSKLDISARQAYYFVNVVRKSMELGVSRQQMVSAGISKLKEILSLDPKDYAEVMRNLIEASPSESHSAIKAKVAAVKQKAGIPDADYLVLKFEPSVRDLVTQVFGLAKFNHGEQVDEYGEVTGEASDSKCMEIICLSYLQDPNNHGQDMPGDV